MGRSEDLLVSTCNLALLGLFFLGPLRMLQGKCRCLRGVVRWTFTMWSGSRWCEATSTRWQRQSQPPSWQPTHPSLGTRVPPTVIEAGATVGHYAIIYSSANNPYCRNDWLRMFER